MLFIALKNSPTLWPQFLLVSICYIKIIRDERGQELEGEQGGVYRNVHREESIEENDVIILLKIRGNSKHVCTSHATILILYNQSFEDMILYLVLLENN